MGVNAEPCIQRRIRDNISAVGAGTMGKSETHAVKRVSTASGPAVDLRLSREEFATGRPLSGVVVFRCTKPANVRSIKLVVHGRETPAGHSLVRSRTFFERELLLTGKDMPRFRSERISEYWNAFLMRDTGRRLSAGEHLYPFSFQLPASLPSSYDGKAGRIEYIVTAIVKYPMGGWIEDSRVTSVVFVPRTQRGSPVALGHPNAGNSAQTSDISVSLMMPSYCAQIGQTVSGKFFLTNPKGAEVRGVTVSLETCEWVRLARDRQLQKDEVDSVVVRPADTMADTLESDFALSIPADAMPTIEGTAISVIWFVKLLVETDPPVEFKAPITVHAPVVSD
jgi:hypothetical protein